MSSPPCCLLALPPCTVAEGLQADLEHCKGRLAVLCQELASTHADNVHGFEREFTR